MRALVAMVVAIGLGMPASAQSESQVKVRYKERTVLELDPQEIEGKTDGPAVQVIGSRRLSRFAPNLPVRLSFVPELLRSSSHL